VCVQCAAGAAAAAGAVGGAAGLRLYLAARLGPRALRVLSVVLCVAAVLAAGLLA